MLTGLVINEIKIAGNHRMQIRHGMHARQIAVACHPVVVVDEEQIFAFCIVYTDISGVRHTRHVGLNASHIAITIVGM